MFFIYCIVCVSDQSKPLSEYRDFITTAAVTFELIPRIHSRKLIFVQVIGDISW